MSRVVADLRGWGEGDGDGREVGVTVPMVVMLDGGAESVLQDLGENVFQMHRDVASGGLLACLVLTS